MRVFHPEALRCSRARAGARLKTQQAARRISHPRLPKVASCSSLFYQRFFSGGSESGSKDDVGAGIYKEESEGIKLEKISKNTEKRGKDAGFSRDSAVLLAAACLRASWGCFYADDEAQNMEVKDSKVFLIRFVSQN